MKKLATIIICLIFVICLFSGCNNPEVPDPMPEQDQPTNSLSMAMVPFKIAADNGYPVEGYGNDDGFYSLRRNQETDSQDMSCNILYIDYATKKQIYLCAQPNCGHDNETCTSRIDAEYEMYTAALAIVGDKLAVIHLGVKPYIDIMDLSGANKKTLCEFEDGAFINEDVIASNGQYLMLGVDRYSHDENDNLVSVANTLCAIDIITGEQITIYSHAADNNNPDGVYVGMRLAGVSETGVIIRVTTIEQYQTVEDPEITYENMMNATRHEYFSLPYDGGEMVSLVSFYESSGYGKACMAGPYIVYILRDGDTVKLYRTHTATGETVTLIDDFTKTDIDTEASYNLLEDVWVDRYFIDNKIFIRHMYGISDGIQRVVDYYAVDINSGEMQQLTLSYNYYGISIPLTILARFGDKLLVHAKTKEIDDGRAMNRIIYSSAIISVDDYLASNPNFDWIDTVS